MENRVFISIPKNTQKNYYFQIIKKYQFRSFFPSPFFLKKSSPFIIKTLWKLITKTSMNKIIGANTNPNQCSLKLIIFLCFKKVNLSQFLSEKCFLKVFRQNLKNIQNIPISKFHLISVFNSIIFCFITENFSGFISKFCGA